MHASVHQFFRDYTEPEMFKGKTIIEVGSYDVNGSIRDAVEAVQPKSYLGVDFIAGPRVDKVLDAVDLIKEFGKNSFDVVVSTEMLEHAEHWRVCINNMKDLTKDLLIITTRGPGFPLHSYPHDWWRYTTDDFAKIFADFDIKVNMNDTDPSHPGVFFIAHKTRRKRVNLDSIELTPAPTK